MALSVYRTKVIRRFNGWSGSIGEDIVLTWAMIEAGYRVGFQPTAVGFTEVPQPTEVLPGSESAGPGEYKHQRAVFGELGSRIPGNIPGFVLHTPACRISISPVCPWGYCEETGGSGKTW